jgi:hypothetical protein
MGVLTDGLAATDKASWSSPKWQHTIFDHMIEKKGQFDTIIEVGYAYGGLSSQLCQLASQHNLNLVLIDISEKMYEITKEVLEELNYYGIKDRVTFYDKQFLSFAKEENFEGKAIVIIDASHYFEPTIRDISAMYYFKQRPISVFLHDYSLRRYPDPNGLVYVTAVDHAIKYCFGDDAQPTFVGGSYDSPNEGWDHPYESTKAYYVHGGWEGCMFSPLPKPIYVYGMEFEQYKNLVEDWKC